MTQTMYVHVNKWIKKNHHLKLIEEGYRYSSVVEYLLGMYEELQRKELIEVTSVPDAQVSV
jgi:hypothetical protein